jgi:hypothetical protein
MSMQENFNQTMKFFFTIQNTNKLYHLNTTSFARHKATDAFDESLQSHIDKFAETFIGRYKLKPVINHIKINPYFLSDSGIEELFIQIREYLQNFNKMYTDPDLLNIRDDLLVDVNKTIYLFQLK